MEDVLNIIEEKYYYSLSEEKKEKIKEIAREPKDSEEKIKEIMELLDRYSQYYSVEYCKNLTKTPERQVSLYGFETVDDVYIRLEAFTPKSGKEFGTLIDTFSAEKPLYLDLRECSGGYISAMLEIAEWLLPPGMICTANFKKEKRDYWLEENSRYKADRILYVIVSERTASAGEILAGAIQKSKVGIVVGTGSTFGKTQIQEFMMLDNGGVLKLTVGEYLVGGDWDIQQTGISPEWLLVKQAENNESEIGK